MRWKHLLRCSEPHYSNWVPELLPQCLMAESSLCSECFQAFFPFLFLWDIHLNEKNFSFHPASLITALWHSVHTLPAHCLGALSKVLLSEEETWGSWESQPFHKPRNDGRQGKGGALHFSFLHRGHSFSARSGNEHPVPFTQPSLPPESSSKKFLAEETVLGDVLDSHNSPAPRILVCPVRPSKPASGQVPPSPCSCLVSSHLSPTLNSSFCPSLRHSLWPASQTISGSCTNAD